MNAEEILARQRAQAKERQRRYRERNEGRRKTLTNTRNEAVAMLTRSHPVEYRRLIAAERARGRDIDAAVRVARAALRDAHREQYEKNLAKLRKGMK